MDRNSFLESLPFLVPCPSSAGWPLQQPVTQIHHEEAPLLLTNHQLSIEPLLCSSSSSVKESSRNMGVAFFEADCSSTLANKDPALTPCELEFCIVRSGSSNETMLRRPSSISPPSGGGAAAAAAAACAVSSSLLSPAGTRQKQTMTALLSMKINDRVYYVNWTRLTHVQTVEQEPQKEYVSAKPPCLMLYFPSCLFRIFTLDFSFSSDTTNVTDQYHALQDVIHRVLTESSSSSSPSSIIVPTLSDHSFESLLSSPKSSSTSGANSSSGGRSNDQEAADLEAARFQHQHHALRQCHDEFSSLWTLLLLDQYPGTPLSSLANKNNSLGRDIASLLTTVAQDLATSLGGSGGDNNSGSQDYDSACYHANQRLQLEEQLQLTQKQMETALNDFFPAPRINKRKDVSGEQKLEQVQELVQQHKRIVRERHKLLGLSTRV